jgi:serine/tyrosine/threonine adenylyltransferase
MRRKIGLATAEEEDGALIQALLNAMSSGSADFTLTFRHLGDAALSEAGDATLRSLFEDPVGYDSWAATWRQRLAREPGTPEQRREAMNAANPAYIPRNHLVEESLEAAAERMDFAPFEALVEVLADPYRERAGLERYTLPAKPDEKVLRTFCGT